MACSSRKSFALFSEHSQMSPFIALKGFGAVHLVQVIWMTLSPLLVLMVTSFGPQLLACSLMFPSWASRQVRQTFRTPSFFTVSSLTFPGLRMRGHCLTKWFFPYFFASNVFSHSTHFRWSFP